MVMSGTMAANHLRLVVDPRTGVDTAAAIRRSPATKNLPPRHLPVS
jgi:hypothetical protein